MKAQSELAGDRKRQAETTCPRSGGVTSWIDEINKMHDIRIDWTALNEVFNKAAHADEASRLSLMDSISTSFDTSTSCDTDFAEVNLSPCRSAMAGLHSVNSANLCVLYLTT